MEQEGAALRKFLNDSGYERTEKEVVEKTKEKFAYPDFLTRRPSINITFTFLTRQK